MPYSEFVEWGEFFEYKHKLEEKARKSNKTPAAKRSKPRKTKMSK